MLDKSHPVWIIAKIAMIILLVYVVERGNAQNFSADERYKILQISIGAVLVIAGGAAFRTTSKVVKKIADDVSDEPNDGNDTNVD